MITPSEVALVSCGGALGATLRFILTRSTDVIFPAVRFPIATLAVNILGCFALGCVAEISARGAISPNVRLLFATGILGGFTTFSAFGVETISLLRAGHTVMALNYIAASVIGGCIATYVGILAVTPQS
jgi:CrcB protein